MILENIKNIENIENINEQLKVHYVPVALSNNCNLRFLSNSKLLELVKFKSKQEKELTLELIQLIREVERRKIYLDKGFGSLFSFVCQELGYEESAAIRRISAARLIAEIPEVQEKVASGKLSLSNIVKAQIFFRKEEKLKQKKVSRIQKMQILQKIENKSLREAEKTLLEISPEQICLKETHKVISCELTEVRLVMHDRVLCKLEKLKNLLSHSHPTITNAELIEKLADMALKKMDPTVTR